MTDNSTMHPPREKKRWRRFFWLALAGVMLLLVANALLSDIDVPGEDRIALVRIEGVILDAKDTVADLKRFGDSSSVKAIVLRIDSPGGGVVPSLPIGSAPQAASTPRNGSTATPNALGVAELEQERHTPLIGLSPKPWHEIPYWR